MRHITDAFAYESADKRIEILRLIGISGSISQAARDAKVSYKAAWQAIDTLNNLAGVALVDRSVGGSGGGGSSITPAGQKLLTIADLLARSRQQVFTSFVAKELPLPLDLPALAGMSVRTSMRNQLPCRVQKLVIHGQVAQVHLLLTGAIYPSQPMQLVSRITKASAELLGLKKGQQVLALCKATAVIVSRLEQNRAAAETQLLTGLAIRVNRNKSGDEVALQLDSGQQLVGFATASSGLKKGGTVMAAIHESTIVIALTT